MKIRDMVTSAALTALFLALFIPNLVYTFPFLAGFDGSYTVMSGSMSPALSPGDLVIVKEMEHMAIEVGNIVTVESEEFTYTHRVVEKLDGGLFRLKGDANEESDQGLIEASQIIGKVVLVFPFGHLYKPYGFALALLTPAFLIIGKQVNTVYQFTKRRNRRETMRWRRKRHSALDTGTLLLALILTVSTTRVIAPHFISGSSSYFSDVEWSTSLFSSGIWEITVTVDIKPETLNLESQGEWITVHAYIETVYDENYIDISTVELEGIPADDDEWTIEDGRLMVKFDRTSVIDLIISKVDGDVEEVNLTVSGEFTDGVRFTGSDTIKVVNVEG